MSGHGEQLPRDVGGLGAQRGGDGCCGGMENLWGEGLQVGVDEPVCSGEAEAEQLPPLMLSTRRPFPLPLFALEAAESSPGICQERSLVLHFWRGGLLGGKWKSTGESGHVLPCCHPLACKGSFWASPKGLVCFGRCSEVQ